METPPPLVPDSSGPSIAQWKVILHISGLAGLLFPPGGNIIAPLVIWLIKKPVSPALDAEGRKVLNFQISFFLYEVLAVVVGHALFFLIIPLTLPYIVMVIWLIFTILGTVKMSNGEEYRYPFTIKML